MAYQLLIVSVNTRPGVRYQTANPVLTSPFIDVLAPAPLAPVVGLLLPRPISTERNELIAGVFKVQSGLLFTGMNPELSWTYILII